MLLLRRYDRPDIRPPFEVVTHVLILVAAAQVVNFTPITSMYGAVHCSSQVCKCSSVPQILVNPVFLPSRGPVHGPEALFPSLGWLFAFQRSYKPKAQSRAQ